MLVIASGHFPGSLGDVRRAVGGPVGYAVVGLFTFIEVGTFLGLVGPFEFASIAGGALAASGELSLPLVLLVVWASAGLGDSFNFLIGRKLGRSFLLRHGHRVRVTPERLARIDGYFERRGPATVFFGRFGMFVRTLVPFLAGSAGMRYAKFLPWSVLGCAAFALVLSGMGYIFYEALDQAAGAVGVIGVIVLLGVLIVVIRRMIRRRRGAVL